MRNTTNIFLLLFLVLFACTHRQSNEISDFPQLLEKDTLLVLTLNTSVSYFTYRDKAMGYHYDMVVNFCKQHGLVPHIVVGKNTNELLTMLRQGKGDVIAYSMPIENQNKEWLIYCGLFGISRQVVVQRSESVDTLLHDVTDLLGKELTLIKDSKYEQRVLNLDKELGGGIKIKYVDADTLVTEDLIRMVSAGEIKYTVADEYLAKLNRTYFRNINASLPVSFSQRYSWAVTKEKPILADSLNSWFQKENKKPFYSYTIKRYFEETKGYDPKSNGNSVSFYKPGEISCYDFLFKKYGEQYNVDWCLLAAISYHESRFKTNLSSWVGAVGLMGVMPATGKAYGVCLEELHDPEKNVEVGAKILKKILSIFSAIENYEERVKFALAAYNAGIGHVYDARALAEKYGADKDVWEGNVEKYLDLKRLEQYYDDPVCKSGYFRGTETINYVRKVIALWNTYKSKIKE